MGNFPIEWVPSLAQIALVIWLFSDTRTRVKALEKTLAEEKIAREKMADENKVAHVKLADKLDSFGMVQARADEKLGQLVREQTMWQHLADPAPRKRVKRRPQAAE